MNQLNWQLCWELNLLVHPLLVHKVHRDVEHWLSESSSTVAVAQIPNFGTDLSIKFGLLHHRLHLRIS